MRKYLRRLRLVPAVAGLLLLIVAAPPASAAASPHGPPATGLDRDWLLPDEVPPDSGVRSVSARSSVGNPCPGCSSGKVTYNAFEGYEVTLNEYRGKHVRVLLPDHWVARLTEEEIVGLVESGDRGYELLRDMVGREPFLGDDLLSLAFVPSTCGIGCAVIGHGRSELWDGTEEDEPLDEDWLARVASISAEGIPNLVVLHELTHNFDVYASHLWYHHDSSHFWTDVVTGYGYVYGMLESDVPIGFRVIDDFAWYDREIQWLDWLRQRYLEDPDHSWATCVRDSDCQGTIARAVRAWVTLEIVRNGGPSLLADAIRSLETLRGTEPPPDPEDREALWLEALAAAAGADLTACLDPVRWLNTPELAQRLAAQGPPAAMCQDGDGDGVTPFFGDCRDGDASAGPHGVEVPGNGLDDNCNRRLDEAFVDNAQQVGSVPSPPLVLRIDAPAEVHTLSVPLPRPGRFRIISCSAEGGFRGWIGLRYPGGGWAADFATFVDEAGQCYETAQDVREVNFNPAQWPATGTLEIHPSQPGPVEVTLRYEGDYPAPWGTFRVTQVDQRRLVMTATVADDSAWRTPGNEMRFELSGFGRLGTVPLVDGQARLELTVPVDLEAGRLLYAYAQPATDGIPAAGGLRQVFRPIDVRPCEAGPDTACLLGGRFEVKGVMHDFSQPPKPFPLQVMHFPGGRAASHQAAFFDSFTQGNFEIGVKMVDGCTLPEDSPGRAYWLFVGGLTTADSLVEVEDTVTGEVYRWTNPPGNLPQTLADTDAFACDGETPPPGACTTGSHRACLLDRFRVTGVMKDFADPPGDHTLRVMDFPGGRAESSQAAFFDSFTRGNFEVGVKMVDGCTLPPGNPGRAYWLFVGGLTSADTEVVIRQVSTGETVTWANPPGNLPRSTADTAAFACE